MADTAHLVALHGGLAREKQRLAKAKTSKERELRRVWVSQREREIEKEMEFLGIATVVDEISVDELLSELN